MAVCQPVNSLAYTFSNWVASDLPMQYELYSDKFPINTFDDNDTISSIANDGAGNATITLSSTSETYVKREYIRIQNASEDEYNGIWQVLSVVSSTEIVIDAPFTSTATGNFQRYYRNYMFRIKIYAGIPSGHTYNSENPIAEVGEIKVRPGSDGVAVIDVSDYVRSEIKPITNKLCQALADGNGFHANDWRMWTGFYISYAESYDQSDGFEVTTYTSDYTSDTDTGYSENIYYTCNSALQFQDPQGRSIGGYAIADTDPDEVPAQFMTTFSTPRYFVGKEFDIAIIIALDNSDLSDLGYGLEYVLTEYDITGSSITSHTNPILQQDQGVYRFAFSEFDFNGATTSIEFYIQSSTGNVLSEVKTILVDSESCGRGDILLRWLNPVGGYDTFYFIRNHDFSLRVTDRQIRRRNIFKDWDDEFVSGDTQDDYFATDAVEARTVRTQFLTNDEAVQMKWLLSSNKVYEVFQTDDEGCARHKQRTVLIDPGEYLFRTLKNKLNKLEFSYRYTDSLILPGQ